MSGAPITGGWLGTLPAPPDAERRLTDFAELLALAVANADSRAALAASEATAHKLEQEQAALRRVATAVARGDSPDDVFAATVAELHAVAAADATTLVRYESDVSITLLAARGESGFELGSPIPLIGESVTAEVRRTGRTARIDNFERASGPIPARLRANGIRSGVGAPIVVEGRLWGVMTCGWTTGPPPQDAEARVAQFTDLVGTAIANAESRAELLASRARIVATADQTRRRIERDLHDGAQQRLVTLTMKLRALEAVTAPQPEGVKTDSRGDRGRPRRCARRPARDRKGAAPGDPVPRRARSCAQGARTPIARTCGARRTGRGPPARTGRGGSATT